MEVNIKYIILAKWGTEKYDYNLRIIGWNKMKLNLTTQHDMIA